MTTVADQEERSVAQPQKLSPMLTVHDCEGAIEFYKRAFGAVEVGQRYPWEGKIGHAEISVNGALIMLADEFPEYNITPQRLGGSPVTLHLSVDDVDATLRRATEAGAEVLQPPKNEEYGRASTIRDPYGHKWMLNAPVKS